MTYAEYARPYPRSSSTLASKLAAITLSTLVSLNAGAASLMPGVDDPRLKPATVLVSSQFKFKKIVIDGYIHAPTVEAFRDNAKLNGDEFGVVYLNSAGGDLAAAMELGRLIRASGFATQIGKVSAGSGAVKPWICESACPIAFVGGKFRLLDPQAGHLGVHHFYVAAPGRWAADSKLLFSADKDLRAYLDEMGIDPEFFELIKNTPPDQMRKISLESAYYWKVSTGREQTHWDEMSSDELSGTVESSTGTMRMRLSCNDGEILMSTGFKPWFPAAALLNYDTHDVTVNGQKFPIPEVAISFEKASGYLTTRTELTEGMLDAMADAKSVGYSFSFGSVDGDNSYGRSIDFTQQRQSLAQLRKQCD